MNAKELQYMMETNEFSLAETLIIAELRRRDGVENVLRSEVQLWKDKYDDQSRSLEGHIKINEDMSRQIVELSMELEQLHKGCMSAFPTCGCRDRIKGLEDEIKRLKSELERPVPADAKRKPDVWKTGEGQCATTLPVIMSPDERIENLESQIRDRDETIAAINDKHECANQLIDAKNLIETLERQVAARDREITKLNCALDFNNKVYAERRDASSVIEMERNELRREVESRDARLDEAHRMKVDYEKRFDELHTTIHELTTELTELKSKNSTLRKRFAARG